MPTPKARFLEQKAFVEPHRDLVVSTPFTTAADAAMLQLLTEEARNPTLDPVIAAAGYQRLVGAVKYRAMLETIGDAPLPPPPKRHPGNLEQNR